jgi:hypothetical protein
MTDGAHRRRRWIVATTLVALAVLAVPSAAQAGGSILSVTPHHLKFGRQPFGSVATRTPPFCGLERADLTVTAATESGKILRTRHVRITGVGIPAT